MKSLARTVVVQEIAEVCAIQETRLNVHTGLLEQEKLPLDGLALVTKPILAYFHEEDWICLGHQGDYGRPPTDRKRQHQTLRMHADLLLALGNFAKKSGYLTEEGA